MKLIKIPRRIDGVTIQYSSDWLDLKQYDRSLCKEPRNYILYTSFSDRLDEDLFYSGVANRVRDCLVTKLKDKGN